MGRWTAWLYGIGLVEQSWCPLLACCLAACSCGVPVEGALLAARTETSSMALSPCQEQTLHLHPAAACRCWSHG